MLEEKLTEWVHKVLTAYETAGMTDILQMIVDVDRIIAEAFDHTPVLEETQYQQAVAGTAPAAEIRLG